MEENLKIPNHVAIILDGNGRWAKAKGMPRNYGHVQGAKTVEVICEEAYRMGIQYLTVYAFSTENWNRPQDEVDALMKLLRNYMKTCLKTAEKNRMCVRVLGDKTRLDQDIQTRIAELEEATKNNDGLHFQIAINYGGRDEIIRAVKKLSAKVQSGEVSPEAIRATTVIMLLVFTSMSWLFQFSPKSTSSLKCANSGANSPSVFLNFVFCQKLRAREISV